MDWTATVKSLKLQELLDIARCTKRAAILARPCGSNGQPLVHLRWASFRLATPTPGLQ